MRHLPGRRVPSARSRVRADAGERAQGLELSFDSEAELLPAVKLELESDGESLRFETEAVSEAGAGTTWQNPAVSYLGGRVGQLVGLPGLSLLTKVSADTRTFGQTAAAYYDDLLAADKEIGVTAPHPALRLPRLLRAAPGRPCFRRHRGSSTRPRCTPASVHRPGAPIRDAHQRQGGRIAALLRRDLWSRASLWVRVASGQAAILLSPHRPPPRRLQPELQPACTHQA